MNENYIEKSFLYFVAASLVLHAIFFWVLLTLPEQSKQVMQKPYMIDLRDVEVDESSAASSSDKRSAHRQSDVRRRVAKESAPKGSMSYEKLARLPELPRSFQSPPKNNQLPRPQSSQSVRGDQRGESLLSEAPTREVSPSEGIVRRNKPNNSTNLFPSAGRFAKLEEAYRRKYGSEVQEGDAKFLNTDEMQFASFKRRFQNALYGVWNYPQEAGQLGIEGIGLVKITFNRKGEVIKTEILEGSRSDILDKEIIRAIRMLGPLGQIAKGYEKDEFTLFLFYEYVISGGGTSRRLH